VSRASYPIHVWFLVVGSAFVLLTSCASHTTSYRNRLHPGYGQTELQRDWYECRNQSADADMGRVGVSIKVDERQLQRCLDSRGWELTDTPVTKGVSSASTCDWGMYWSSVKDTCVPIGEE
jgi:hypothetical protein